MENTTALIDWGGRGYDEMEPFAPNRDPHRNENLDGH